MNAIINKDIDRNNYRVVNDVPKSIFRAYDIRGIVDEAFTKDNIYTIGLAIGSEALDRGEHTIAIGRDGRLSGPKLLNALQAGIADSGCNVINIGMVTTPILYFATHNLNTRSGAMLTGSHNPPEYNGIKIVIGGETFSDTAILKLHQRITEGDFHRGHGVIEEIDVIHDYMQHIVNDIKIERPLKIVIDCGNGVGGVIAPQLFRALGCEVIELFCDIDGTFPNHHPDPSVEENLHDLKLAVEQHHADVGIAFDGDADRIGVVTNQGEVISSDRLLMFLALDILTRHPQAIIPFDVKCTRNLFTEISKHNGRPLMVQTGHSFVKAKMKQVGALIAGEFSGHIFFKERWFGFDDGVYTATRFAELLSQDKRSCHEIFASLPKSITTSELKILATEETKFPLMEKILHNISFGNDVEVSTIDGVRADFANGFGLIRPSNTTPYLILRFEANTQEDLDKIMQIFKQKLLEIEPNINIPW